MKAIVLRKVAGRFQAMILGFGMRMTAAAEGPSLSSLAFAMCLTLLPVLVVLAALAAITHPATAGFALATAPVVVDKSKLVKLLEEAKKIQDEYKGKAMPEDVGTKFDTMMTEAKEMQDAADAADKALEREQKFEAMQRFARTVPNPTLPAAPEQKFNADIAGYITPGHLAVMSKAFQDWQSSGHGYESGIGVTMKINGPLLPSKNSNQALIALSAPEVKAVYAVVDQMKSRNGLETKDMPVFGDLVIAPDRVDRFVQDSMPRELTLRDILTVVPTTSNLIQYVAEVAYTAGADIQSEGTTVDTVGAKGEADVEYELRDASIKTVADTIPVSEQQLSDAPALISRINTRLLHGVAVKEEQLNGYGSGTGLEWYGFFTTGSGVSAATTPSGSPTLLDKVRAAITDVKKAFYRPGFMWINPTDWEAIETLKGSDGHYVWAIIRDLIGPRAWGLRVVEGVGTQKDGANTTNILIGDATGAVLYDRQQANIAIGWVDDQFAKNLRTIRAEERCVLVIDRPKAFRKINTVA